MRGAVLVCLLAACDSLAGANYVGEPMFTLEGTVVSAGEEVGGVALLWQDSESAGGPGIAATIVPVESEFPSKLRLSIPLPPPDEARFALDGVELAEAYVFAVEDPAQARLVPRGVDRSHVLVFATDDVLDGTQAADYLGGPMSAGYHLRRFVPDVPTGAQLVLIERCVAAGSLREACEARRAYRLEPMPDDDRLRIVVTP